MDEIPRPDSTLMAWLANLAYRTPGAVRQALAGERGLGAVDFFDRDDTQALLITGEDLDLLAFRGTEPDERGDLKADASILTVQSRLGLLHGGFRKALAAVERDISDRRRDPDRLLYLTGHSLGGALAMLAATTLVEHSGKIGGVYTFGAPAVGNRKFAASYERLLGHRTWRFENCQDGVPRLLQGPAWKKAGHLFYFASDGGLIQNPGLLRRWTEEWKKQWHQQQTWREILAMRAFSSQVTEHSMDRYESLVARNQERIESVISAGSPAGGS